MLNISCDTTAAEKKIAAMHEKIAAFPDKMAEELTAWQRDDMKRRYPDTAVSGNEVSTEIWPRSRLELTGQRPKRVVLASQRPNTTRRRGAGKGPPLRSTRPVLRQTLWDSLVERMSKLLETLTWA